MKIAIVGAEESKWTESEKEEVKGWILDKLLPMRFHRTSGQTAVEKGDTLISGGCPKGGVDIWAEEIADKLGMKKQIFKPEVEQWEDESVDGNQIKPLTRRGYKSRNIQIAEACDILYCFSPGRQILRTVSEVWNGGIWTANYAKKLGKKVIRIVVEVE